MPLRFLEISATSPDVLASLTFWRTLGFNELTTGEAWDYPYAVVSDGRLCLGLHGKPDVGPALTFVLPGLAKHLHNALPAAFEMRLARISDEHFHHATYEAPGGHAVHVLEARTFSPPDLSLVEDGLPGFFEGYALPSSDLDKDTARWEDAGFVAVEEAGTPWPRVVLTSDALNLILHQEPGVRAPALLFSSEDLEARTELLRYRGFEVARSGGSGQQARSELRSPEGLHIQMLPGEV